MKPVYKKKVIDKVLLQQYSMYCISSYMARLVTIQLTIFLHIDVVNPLKNVISNL